MLPLPQTPSNATGFTAPPGASGRRGTLGLRPVGARQRPQRHHRELLTDDLFTAALTRELKRADRFEESFALLVIALTNGKSAATWSELVDILITSKSETDIIGWVEQDAAIGLIRPLVQLEPIDAATALAATLQRELARILSRDNSATCSIRLDVYSPQSHALTPVLRDRKAGAPHASVAGRNAQKRVLDILGSVALLAVLAPVFLLISTLIKLTSSGPVFFRQARLGQGARPFTMFKFRTMQVNADEGIHQQYVTEFIQSGAHAAPAPNKVFKIVDDPRVTRLGHLLRRSSLDELPQFWNVLRGDMSLVGPRPPLPYEVARYKRWHRRRLFDAKPGITGLWQVTGRSRTTFDEMVRLDLRYATQYSLWTDIKILLATPRAVVSGNGAH
jgi:lipopolysaccharide/colanic/teichoic acid biosynthesis glycosyltransferase